MLPTMSASGRPGTSRSPARTLTFADPPAADGAPLLPRAGSFRLSSSGPLPSSFPEHGETAAQPPPPLPELDGTRHEAMRSRRQREQARRRKKKWQNKPYRSSRTAYSRAAASSAVGDLLGFQPVQRRTDSAGTLDYSDDDDSSLFLSTLGSDTESASMWGDSIGSLASIDSLDSMATDSTFASTLEDEAALEAAQAQRDHDEFVAGLVVDDDRSALCCLFHSLDGPRWRRAKHWATKAPLRAWGGVKAEEEEDDDGGKERVTKLDLGRRRLRGDWPGRPLLSHLTRARTLCINSNKIEGR